LRSNFTDLRFIVCADDDAHRADNPGLTHGREAAAILSASIAVPDFGENRPANASDFNDLHQHAGPEAVRACIERAVPFERTAGAGPEAEAVDREIARLAKLRPGDYERERRGAAERLGFRTSILDKLVAAERPENDKGQGHGVEFTDPEPWQAPVDGAQLLDEIVALLSLRRRCANGLGPMGDMHVV
jgi:putative DNA primase/helicase